MSNPISLRNATAINFSRKHFDAFYTSVLLSSKTKGKYYLLLEGPTDAKVLKKFFDIKIIVLPCIGRSNIVKVFKKLPKTITNVFGIADRDYTLNLFADFRLFYYDANNFEMMVIKDDNLFNESYLFNGSLSKTIYSPTDLINIRNKIISWLFPISAFRKVNMQNIPEKNRVSISDVYPNLALCASEKRTDVIKSIKNNLILHLSNLDSTTVSDIIAVFDSCVNDNSVNFYDVTNGHDFVELFIKETCISSDNDFYNSLEKAYKKDLFVKTNLYYRLKLFETLQMVKIFK